MKWGESKIQPRAKLKANNNKKYFKNQLGNSPEISDRTIQKIINSQLDRKRIWRRIEKIKNGKATSLIEILAEV